MLSSSIIVVLSAVAAVMGGPAMHEEQKRLAAACPGTPKDSGILFQGSSLADTRVRVEHYSEQSGLLTAAWDIDENASLTGTCATRFALGITKKNTAPSSILSADWVDVLAVNGNSATTLVLDPNTQSGNYTIFYVQYDRATGAVLPGAHTQAKGKICYVNSWRYLIDPCLGVA